METTKDPRSPSLPGLLWGHLDEPSQDFTAGVVEKDHVSVREWPARGAEKGQRGQSSAVFTQNVQGREEPSRGFPARKTLTVVGQVRTMHQASADFTPSSVSVLLIHVRMLSFWAPDRNGSIFVTGKKEPLAEMKGWHFVCVLACEVTQPPGICSKGTGGVRGSPCTRQKQ